MRLFAQRGPAVCPCRHGRPGLTICGQRFSQRDLLLPALAPAAGAASPGVTLRIVPSGAPGAELLLRSERVPWPGHPSPARRSADIDAKALFGGSMAARSTTPPLRSAPLSETEYLVRTHATVPWPQARRGLELD